MRKQKGKKRYRVHTKEEIWCCVCKVNSVMSSSDVDELVCGDCFGRMFYREELILQNERVNYAKGWNLKKKYKAPDGKVFSFGEEITGESDARNTTEISTKTRSVSRKTSRTNRKVLSKKNKSSDSKKTKKS
jgi:hypothetical protein